MKVVLEEEEESRIYKFWSEVEQTFKNMYGIQETEIRIALELIKQPFKQNRCSDFSNINFERPVFICAYLQYYAAAHFAITRVAAKEFINQCHLICPGFFLKLCNSPKLNIVSVGGGPGNDLYGFCSALSTWKRNCCFTGCLLKKHLELSILDKRKNWNFATTIAHYMFHSRDSGLTIPSPSFYDDMDPPPTYTKVDFAKIQEVKSIRSTLKSADVILMVKVLSVMDEQTKSVFLQEILQSLKSGSILFYVDVGKKIVLDAVCRLNSERNQLSYSVLHNVGKRHYIRIDKVKNTMPASTFEVCVIQKNQCKNGEESGTDVKTSQLEEIRSLIMQIIQISIQKA